MKDVDNYLRSIDDQRWTVVEKQIKNKIDELYLNVLLFCIEPKTREEIFKQIGIYNNSRNFNKYIKPIIKVNWLQLTIPEKPTSKNQKYLTSNVAKRLVESQPIGMKRATISSSSIASVGYNEENEILEIEFHHGAIYRYFNVPKEVFKGLMNAESKGSYFMYNIKNEYEAKQISQPF